MDPIIETQVTPETRWTYGQTQSNSRLAALLITVLNCAIKKNRDDNIHKNEAQESRHMDRQTLLVNVNNIKPDCPWNKKFENAIFIFTKIKISKTPDR